MVLMMILMLVLFVVPGLGTHHMGSHEPPGMTTQSHEAPGMTTQSHERDPAKSDPREP